MQSVMKLSNDVRRGLRSAKVISGLTVILVLVTILVAHETQASWLQSTTATGRLMFAACLLGSAVTTAVFISARNAILLRTAVWFDHAFTHQFLRRRAQHSGSIPSLAEDKFSLQTVADGLGGGVAARHAEISWLPLYWLALAYLDVWHGLLGFTVATAIFVLSQFPRRTAPELIPFAMLSAFGAKHVTPFDVDQWERQGRAATARAYEFHSHVSRVRLWLGCASIVCFASVYGCFTWLGHLSPAPGVTAATIACLHVRHLWMVFAYLADRPTR
jgi:hypothetical protein